MKKNLGEPIDKYEWGRPMRYVTTVLFAYHKYNLVYVVEPEMDKTKELKNIKRMVVSAL